MAESNRFTEVDLSCMLSSTFSVVSTIVHVLVCTGTIFGNILILCSIYKYSTYFKGGIYMLIGNLAVADLLLGLWVLLFICEEIVPEMEQNWYFCVAKPIGVLISYICSILSLTGISIDRFVAVMFPLRHLVLTQNKKCFMTGLTAIWIISIIGGSLPVILPNLTPQRESFVCRIGVILPRTVGLLSSIGLVFVLIINSTLYGIVIWKIKTKETPGSCNSRKKRTKTGLMFMIFVTFIVCWLPFIICSFLMRANVASSTFQNVVCAQEYLAKLGFVNSALNWVIYGLANKKFRTAFKKILCCHSLSKTASYSAEGSKVNSSSNKNVFTAPTKQTETRL